MVYCDIYHNSYNIKTVDIVRDNKLHKFRKTHFPIDTTLDKFDYYYQHLAVYNQQKDIIAYCRMKMIKEPFESYANTFFNLDKFILKNRNTLEIGRICSCQYNGFYLLFVGIYHIMNHNNLNYVFGLSSVNDRGLSYKLIKYFSINSNIKNLSSIKPRRPLKNNDKYKSNLYKKNIPSPLREYYLHLNATIIEYPSYDCKMNVYDFFTICHINNLLNYKNGIN